MCVGYPLSHDARENGSFVEPCALLPCGLQVWQKEREDFDKLAEEVDVVDRKVHKTEKKHKRNIVLNATVWFWPRLLVTCFAWVANDFAFYGNKLFQNTFIALLYPNVSEWPRALLPLCIWSNSAS